MNHSPAEILRALLVALSEGIDPPTPPVLPDNDDWPVYASNEPSSPDNCITVFDTVWQDDGRAMVTGGTFHHFGVQIRVRSIGHNPGFVKAHNIHQSLDEQVYANYLTIDGSHYIVNSVSGTNVLALGMDAPNTKRSIFVVNARFSLTIP